MTKKKIIIFIIIPCVVAVILVGAMFLFFRALGYPASQLQYDVDSLPPPATYVYHEVDGFRLKGDFYWPDASAGPWPVVLLIHGGGWESGDRAHMAGFAASLIARGYACFSIDYRLMPDGKYPNNIDDCWAAVQWLKDNSEPMKIDPNRIAAMGSSAGGHLAAFLGAEGHVDAVISLFGVFDFTDLKYGDSGGESGWSFMDEGGGNISEHLKLISPASYVTPDDPPVLLIHGIEDSLVPPEQSQIYFDLLQEAGIHSELILVENAEHGLMPVKGSRTKPSRSEIMEKAIDFLDGVLSNENTAPVDQ